MSAEETKPQSESPQERPNIQERPTETEQRSGGQATERR